MLNNQKSDFEKKIEASSKDSLAKMKSLQSEKVPVSTRWSGDEKADNIEIAKIGGNLIELIEDEARRIFDVNGITDAREEERLAQITNNAMLKAVERFEIILGSFDDKISSRVQIDEFWQRTAMLLKSVNPKALLYETAVESGTEGLAVKVFYETIEKNIPKDFTRIVEDILKDSLSEQDRKYIVDKCLRLAGSQSLSDIYKESTHDIRTGEVALLLLNLDQNKKEKAKVMEMIMEKPGAGASILYLSVGGFLTLTQAQELIVNRLKVETDEVKIKDFNKVMEFLGGSTMQKALEFQASAKKEVGKRHEYIFGHKNHIQSIFSLKGATSLYIQGVAVGSGVLTAISYLSAGNLKGLVGNPLVHSALGAGILASTLSKDGINILPNGGEIIAGITKDRTKEKESASENFYANFGKDILDNPSLAKLYYNLTEQINLEYKKETGAGTPTQEIKITFEKLGVDFAKLPEELRVLGEEKAEKKLNEWISVLFNKNSLNKPSAQAQKDYLNEVRTKEGLKGKWETYNLSQAII